jgi:tetratricopeptide (TPR) repeat protein
MLGVLYARYGLADRAEAQFLQALKSGDYYPALVNMGNLRYWSGVMKEALSYYQRAYELAPKSASALLGIARVNSELENLGAARDAYDQLKEVDPVLAGQFAYLTQRSQEGTRASSVEEMKEVVVWQEGSQ